MLRTLLKVLLPLLVLAGAAYGVKLLVDSRVEPEKRSDPAPALLVRAVTAGTRPVAFHVRSQGTVEAATESRLLPRVSGAIEWVSPSFVTGGFFERGEVLVRLDARDHELAVVRAEAAVARADLAVAREEREAEVARDEWALLGEGEPGPLVLRIPQLADTRAAAAAARAELEQARLDLARTEVRAPYDGRVRTRSADLGQVVGPTTELATLYAIDRVEVRLPVPDDEFAFLDVPLGLRDGTADDADATPVVLSARFAGRTWEWTGRVARLEGEIDRRTRMVHLVARVDDPYGRGEVPGRPPLAVGLFVEATITGRSAEDVVVLPRAALRPGGRVFVVEDGRLRFREVDVLRTEAERVVLASGVTAGERVCTSILETPVDGMEVRVEGDAP